MKQATRVALQEAALRLALAKGPDNVRVDEIADAAGVSPRTYNNYFPSREHAIVAAVTASRMPALAAGGRSPRPLPTRSWGITPNPATRPRC
ncbi:TetR/AcrR family transcriptional regulator [Paractinoplanes durhamensis]|uniref:TetR/AcrR family transcriptional regulator n=1 Tax=Paractinoplanes durhamensis TaxID=113563 RepID=UPI003641F557